jgi:hypothetical protein
MKQEKSVYDFPLRELYELEPKEFSELTGGLKDLTELNSDFKEKMSDMTPEVLSKHRCQCKEEFLITKETKRRKPYKRSEPRPLLYLDSDESIVKTFQLRYEKRLSSIAKLVLNSFQKKYIYYAIDDILYSFQSNPSERDNLLAILYSPVLSLQNNFSISFFDIWIDEIYINEISKVNKFLNNNASNFEQCSYITIKLLYKTRMPVKKPDSLW